LHNFEHDCFDKFNGPYINAKKSEYRAAMGLLNLTYYKTIINHRRGMAKKYNNFFKNIGSLKG
tara:strand:+ start:306 stop:494 length:189 start_codon:yes stop_codon:yes gene_type:complete